MKSYLQDLITGGVLVFTFMLLTGQKHGHHDTHGHHDIDDIMHKLDELEEYCLQFAERFFLGDVDWVSWSDFSKKLPIYDSHIFEKQRVILKKNKTMEFSDSIYKYFVFIEDFKLKGTSSPLEYVSSLIQKILINKRKKELINTIEQKLIEEAFSNNNFEIYD